MITYNWNCKTVDAYVEKNNEAEVVYNIHWIVTGTSDEVNSQGNPYSATSSGTQKLDVSDSTNFIPFNQLTNDKLVEWAQATMSEEQIAGIEAGITSQIESLIHPTTITLTAGE